MKIRLQRTLYMKKLFDNFNNSKSHLSCLIKSPNFNLSLKSTIYCNGYSTIPLTKQLDKILPDMQAEAVPRLTMFFIEGQEENEKMKAFESNAQKNQPINISHVNEFLQRAVLRRDNRFGPRVARLIKRNNIYPNLGTFRLLIEMFCQRREFDICNTLLRMLEIYSLEETAEIRNIIVKGLFESKKHQARAWAEFQRSILQRNLLTADSFVYLLRYGTRQRSSIDMFLQAMKYYNIKPTIQVFEELIYAYSRSKEYTKAHNVLLDERIPKGWISHLEGALISSMAKEGALVQAISIYMRNKTKTACPPLSACKILIEQISIKKVRKSEEDFFEKALPLLLDLCDEPPSEWVHSCYYVALYYFHKQKIGKLCSYLKDALSKWPESADFTKPHFTDEIFFKIMKQHKPDFGLELFRILKKDLEPFATPSRKGHQLLLWSLLDARFTDDEISEVWDELKNANLPYSIYDYMMFFIKAKDMATAHDWYNTIVEMPPHGIYFMLMKAHILSLDR